MSAARRRVALVSYDFGEICVYTASALSASADVLLVLPEEHLAPVRDKLSDAVRLVSFAKPRLRQPLRQAAVCRRILASVRAFYPDVVHVQNAHLWLNLLVLPSLREQPVVVTMHDHKSHLGDRDMLRTPQVATNLAFRRADHLIVHAEQIKREAVERLDLDPAAVHVIPHVALGDLDAPPPEEPDDAPVVLFFGRIWPYKGLEHLIGAQPTITRRHPQARFVIAGEGEPFERYRGLMADPSRFEVINRRVSLAERNRLFERAAVVVLPYVEASQSGVVPVAHAFGRPVVVTAVGGLPEAVEDGKTGLVVPPRDERALADAVVRLLDDRALRRRLGAEGRRRLERECSPAAVAEATMRIYDLAATGRRR